MTKIQLARVRRLVAALRSGKYKQCRNTLHKGDKFCCLGVACDLARRTLKTGWDMADGDLEEQTFLGNFGILPDAVQEYYGFTTGSPKLLCGRGNSTSQVRADDLNDEYCWSFKRIARAFERTFLTQRR